MDKSAQKKLLEFKMGFLEEQRTLLIMKVDAHVNKVLLKGKQWLINSEVTTNSSFQDISHLLEETVLFVTEKMGEIPESCQTTANSPAVSDSSGKESVTLNFLVNDMEAIKGRLSSLTSKMEAFERQTESIAEGVITKHSPLEEKHKTELGQMKTVLENTINEQAKVQTRQDARLNFLEHNFQAFTEKESHYKNQINLMNEELKKQGNSMDQLRNQMNKRLMAINTTVNKMEEHQLSEKQIDNSATGSRQVQDVEYKVDQLQTTARHVSEKMKQHEILLQDLDKKVKDTESSVETLRSSRDFEKPDNVEVILALMDSKGSEILNKVTEQSKQMETQYIRLCQTVANRLASLEMVKDVFNKNQKTLEENRKLKAIMEDMQTLLPRVLLLESQCVRHPVGFTAHFPCPYTPVKDRPVQHFTYVYANIGGNFNPESGFFTAPYSGFYIVILTVTQIHQGDALLQVAQHKSEPCVNDCNFREKVCILKAQSTCTRLAVVYLNEQDMLRVEVTDVQQQPQLLFGSSFTCFSISNLM